MELTSFAAHAAAFLLSVSLKTVPLFLAAGLAYLALRPASAASRHLLWAVTFVSLLCLPVFCVLLPPLAAPVLPVPVLPAPLHRAGVADDVPQVKVGITSPSRQPATTPSTDANFVPAPEASRLPADDKAAANSVSTRVFAQKFNSSSATTAPTVSVRTVSSLPHSKPVLSSSVPKLTGAEWLLAIWLIGMTLVLSRTMLGLLGAARLVRSSVVVASGPLAEAAEEARCKLNLSTMLSVRGGLAVTVPMTFGVSRPVVLLPTRADAWPAERLQAVMLHEMGHIKRRDWVTAMLAEVVCALYWFHPLVWLAARQLRAESEQACDDLVLTSGIPPAEYADHLLEVVRGLTKRRGSMPAVVTMACKQDITARVKTILATSKNRSAATGRGLAAGILAALVVVLPLAAVRPMAAAGAADKAETKTAQPQTDAIPSPLVITVPGDTRSPKQISDWRRINQWRRSLLASHTSPWKATLPNGTCVYLTSLWALNGANAQKTWTPDGTLLSDGGGGSLPFYKHLHSIFCNVDVILVFPSDAVRRQTRIAFGSTEKGPSYGTDLAAFERNGFSVGSRRFINTGFQYVFPPAQQKTSLVVSLAIGPEAVLVSGSPLSGGTRRLATGETVAVTKAEPLPKSSMTQVQFSLPSRFVRNESEYKIAAIDKEGLPLPIPGASQSYPVFQGKNATVRYVFQASKLPLDRIKEFRLTYRPSQTVVFPNALLHPKASTGAAVSQSALPAAQSAAPSQSALLSDGTRVRLVQITPVHAENRMNPYGPAWSPDGSPSQFRGVSPSEGFVNSPIEMLPGRNRFDTYGYARLDLVTTPRRNFDAGQPSFVPHGSGHADITVPLATGPYTAVISGPLDRDTLLKLGHGETAMLSKVVVRPSANNPVGKRLGPVAEVELTLPDRLLQGGYFLGYRLDAMGADGKPILALGFSGPTVVYHGHGMTRVAFDTRTAELARLKVSGFRFECRAIHPVIFRNVALQPDIASAQSGTDLSSIPMANPSPATALENFDATTWTQGGKAVSGPRSAFQANETQANETQSSFKHGGQTFTTNFALPSKQVKQKIYITPQIKPQVALENVGKPSVTKPSVTKPSVTEAEQRAFQSKKLAQVSEAQEQLHQAEEQYQTGIGTVDSMNKAIMALVEARYAAANALLAPATIDPSIVQAKERLRRVTAGYQAKKNTSMDVDQALILLLDACRHQIVPSATSDNALQALELADDKRSEDFRLAVMNFQAGKGTSLELQKASAAASDAHSHLTLYQAVTLAQNYVDSTRAAYQQGATSYQNVTKAIAVLQYVQARQAPFSINPGPAARAADVAAAQDNLRQTEAMFQNGVGNALDVDKARAALLHAQANQLGTSGNAEQAARAADITVAQEQLRRAQTLYQSGAGTASDLEKARADLEKARAAVGK